MATDLAYPGALRANLPTRAARWVWRNLFGTVANSLITLAILWLVAALLREQRLRRAWQTLVQRLLELWNRSHAPPDDP